jgi:hypothetical protein
VPSKAALKPNAPSEDAVIVNSSELMRAREEGTGKTMNRINKTRDILILIIWSPL